MNRYLGVALFALTGLSTASAADLPLAPRVGATVPTITWTGCYVGIHGGGGLLESSFTGGYGGGAIAGGQLGCNYQTQRIVFGVEGEGYWSGLTNTFSFTSGTPSTSSSSSSLTVANHWDASLAVRFGFLPDERVFIYGKLGAAVGGFDYNVQSNFTQVGIFPSNSFSVSDGSGTAVGALVGGGAEVMFAPRWTAKVEYNYVNYPGHTVDILQCSSFAGCVPSSSTISNQMHLVKVGLNYLIGGLPR